jgi:N6-L-threonylcarbamoyladenine synthase
LILALESSCDETAVAVFDPRRGLTGEWIQSQIAVHEAHGGVVPALAAREHLRHFAPLLRRAGESLVSPKNAAEEPNAEADGRALFAKAGEGARPYLGITEIAVTYGPGLAPCLAIGVAAAKALALARRVPLVGVNHLRAHAWSPFIGLHAAGPGEFAEQLELLLPHLGLIVSGGHTLLCALGSDRQITALSSTRDDAAGEALDKGAKLLGLGYPGGPLIEKLAAGGRDDAFAFPRGLERSGDLDFSFSGLKTSLRYVLEKMAPRLCSLDASDAAANPALARGDSRAAILADLCASYQRAVVDALVAKTRLALAAGGFRSLGLSGGVANNRGLREALGAEAARARVRFLAADPSHTGDNAGMIAFAAWADRTGVDRSGMGLRITPSLGLEA